LFGLALALPAQNTFAIVGSVKIVRGNTTIHRGSQIIPAVEGLHLQASDRITTSAGGVIGIILQDGTRISLGPNTTLDIDRFLYEPAEGRFGLVLRLIRGAMAYISGRLAQFSPGSVQVETPVGIVGLRGTEFAISLEGS
jgi:hypothetical protein